MEGCNEQNINQYFAHETAVIDMPCKIGSRTKIWHFSHVMKNSRLGENCNLGQNVMIASKVVLGNNVKIQNNVSIYTGVICEDDVFIGPSVVFTNITNPRSAINRQNEYVKTHISKGASIGANSTIVCGNNIGAYALIGAGSVVTKDVKPYALVVGNPSRQIGWISEHGHRLEFNSYNLAICKESKQEYSLKNNSVVKVKMNIDFANLKLAYLAHQEEFQKEITRVLSSASYIMGPEVEKLESALCQFTGAKYSITCSSGTDALLLAMMALGIKAGDEVITTPFTFISTAETIALLGAKPVFVDIDKDTYNIDTSQIESKINNNTKAIIPVSLFGQVADMDEINNLGEKYSLSIIEDAAQSFGASYKGKKSCNLSSIACTSFFPAKPLGCFGDGGAVFTMNNTLAEKIKSLRVHGQTQPYKHNHIGLGARLDNVQAAVLLVKLKSYSEAINLRQAAAERYNKMLHDLVETPYVKSYNSSVWAQYCIKVPSRDLIKLKLKELGIPTAVYYPTPTFAKVF